MQLQKLSGFDNLYIVDACNKEIEQLYQKSIWGRGKFHQKLSNHLKILDSELEKAITYKDFEKLENANLFSIRFISKDNPRIIYAFFDEQNRIILLTAFKEKNRSDYSAAIKTATNRLKQLKGEINL